MKIVSKRPFAARTAMKLPLHVVGVAAGFPSPAEDYEHQTLDLNEYLVRHPEATFFVRVEGESMSGAGIHSGDILIVDRALEAGDGDIVVACLATEFTVKRLRIVERRFFLMPENDAFKPIEIGSETESSIWGVVTGVLRKFRGNGRSR